MHPQSDEYQIIWLIRRLFRSLAHRSDEILRDLSISAADRAVLEFLLPDRKLSVPAIAAQYKVSRQHVQVTVNRLVEAGLLSTSTNPSHKRSPLLGLTAKGKKLFRTITTRDMAAISALFSHVPEDDIQITRKTLDSLLTELNKGDSSC